MSVGLSIEGITEHHVESLLDGLEVVGLVHDQVSVHLHVGVVASDVDQVRELTCLENRYGVKSTEGRSDQQRLVISERQQVISCKSVEGHQLD